MEYVAYLISPDRKLILERFFGLYRTNSCDWLEWDALLDRQSGLLTENQLENLLNEINESWEKFQVICRQVRPSTYELINRRMVEFTASYEPIWPNIIINNDFY